MPVVMFKERVEVALPARMMFAIANLRHVFVIVDAERGPQQLDRMHGLLRTACLEPLVRLPLPVARKVGALIDRLHADVMADFDNAPADKVAAAIFYFLKDLTDSGYLELWEGSPVAEAAAIYIPMIEHVFEQERLDASAQKAARRILKRLQEKGYYV